MLRNTIFLLFIGLFLVGCSTSNMMVEDQLNSLKENPSYREDKQITLDCSYKEAFKATVSVFHDLGIAILKKEFDGKEIFATDFTLAAAGSASRYLVSFKQDGDKVLINIRKSTFTYNYESDFIFEKIKKELDIQKKLN